METAREAVSRSSRRSLNYRVIDSECELQCELHNSSTVFIDDLTEVIESVVSELEAFGWVTRIRRPTSTIWHLRSHVADCVECEKDVAATETSRRSIDLRWIRLIEHVEKPCPELKLLRLSDTEVLEEGDVEVTSARRPNIEGRLRWTSIGK